MSKRIEQLTHYEGFDGNPCFSPDGKRIAFVSNRGGRQQIWVMNRDGSNPILLTQGTGESLDPYWANLNEEEKR